MKSGRQRRRQWLPLGPFYGMVLVLLTSLSLGASGSYEDHFTGMTLRFDYYHSGTSEQEEISVDRFRLEGEWPGSRKRLIDDSNLGKYLFQVLDARNDQVIYSRGFASIFGEWETISEAKKGVRRTFHESQRFPEPRAPVRLVLKKRGREGSFQEIFTTSLDPQSRIVDRASTDATGTAWTLFENGANGEKVDLLILGDGYRAGQSRKFRADVERLVAVLFDTEPFRSRKGDFNVRGLDLTSAGEGISDPRAGQWRNTPLELSFNAFDLDRYVLTYANRRLREIVAGQPYDALIILFNSRKYGGGGIFNLWATCASDTKPSAYVFVHEFGHSFAGLGDEYYSSEVAYESFNPPGVEPWEPNITALLDPADLKWKQFLQADTPLPTPWNQEAYDRTAADYQAQRRALAERGASDREMEALFDESARTLEPLIRRERFVDRVGAFEGAAYAAKGLYRPAVDCIMFSRNREDFCPVCSAAIEQVIDLHIGRSE